MRKFKETLGVDIDGVLAEQNETMAEFIQEEHGIDFTPERVTCRNPSIPEINSDYATQFKLAQENDNFYERMDPIEGAREALWVLKETYNIHIVTHRDEDEEATTEWLNKHNMNYDKVFHPAPQNKGELDIDILIDDFPSVIEDALDSGVRCIQFVRNGNIGNIPDGAWVASSATEKPLNHRKQWEDITTKLRK